MQLAGTSRTSTTPIGLTNTPTPSSANHVTERALLFPDTTASSSGRFIRSVPSTSAIDTQPAGSTDNPSEPAPWRNSHDSRRL